MSKKTFNDKSKIKLTAKIDNGKVTAIEYSDTAYTKFEDDGLGKSANVTLQITASDGRSKLLGTYTPSGGKKTSFSTDDAVTISQVFKAPGKKDESSSWAFAVSVDGSSEIDDPTLILKTKTSRDDE